VASIFQKIGSHRSRQDYMYNTYRLEIPILSLNKLFIIYIINIRTHKYLSNRQL